MFFSKKKNETETIEKETIEKEIIEKEIEMENTELCFCFKSFGFDIFFNEDDTDYEWSCYYDDLIDRLIIHRFSVNNFLNNIVKNQGNLLITNQFDGYEDGFMYFSTIESYTDNECFIKKDKIFLPEKYYNFWKENFYDFFTYLIFLKSNKTRKSTDKYENFDFEFIYQEVNLNDFFEKCLNFENKINYFMQKFDLTFQCKKSFNLDNLFIFFFKDDLNKLMECNGFNYQMFYENIEKQVEKKLKYTIENLFELCHQITLSYLKLGYDSFDKTLDNFETFSFSNLKRKNDKLFISLNKANINDIPLKIEEIENSQQRLLDSINQIKK